MKLFYIHYKRDRVLSEKRINVVADDFGEAEELARYTKGRMIIITRIIQDEDDVLIMSGKA